MMDTQRWVLGVGVGVDLVGLGVGVGVDLVGLGVGSGAVSS
jgi:hypothetical protein